MKSCLPFFLLACLFTIAVVGGFGALWGYFVFPRNENPSLKLFYNGTSHATEYEFDPELCTKFDYHRFYDNRTRIEKERRDFSRATMYTSNIYNDVRFWVVVPCGLAALLSAKLLLAASCSTTILATTHVLYSGICIGIMSLVMGILYQYQVGTTIHEDVNDDAITTLPWITASHVALFLLSMALVVISVFELRRRNVVWPSIHPRLLFTWTCIVLVARLTLGVYCYIFYDMGPLRSGTSTDMCHWDEDDYYGSVYFKYPDYFSLPVAMLLLHGAVVAGEAFFSLLLGSCSTSLVGLDGLISAIGYIFVAVVSSPVFVAFVSTHKGWWQHNPLMVLAVVSCIVALIHTAFRRKMATPPALVTQLATGITTDTTTIATTVATAKDYLSSVGMVLRKVDINSCRINLGIIVMSVIALVLAAVDPGWGGIVMIIGHAAILCRVIPAFIAQCLSCHQQPGSDLQMLIQYILESILLAIGAIGGFFSYWGLGTKIPAGIISICVIFVQGKVIVGIPSVRAAAGMLAEGGKLHSMSDTDKTHLIQESDGSTDVTSATAHGSNA